MAAIDMQLVSIEDDDLGKKSKREADELRLQTWANSARRVEAAC
jgi:hypothetical protein